MSREKEKVPFALKELRQQNGLRPNECGRSWSKRMLADPAFLQAVSPELVQLSEPPKNSMILNLLTKKYPGFGWSTKEVQRPRGMQIAVVFTNYPEIDVGRGRSYHPTLADLLLIEDTTDIRVGSRHHGEQLWTDLMGSAGAKIAQKLHTTGFVRSPDTVIERLSKVLTSGANEVVIHGAFCPDYSYEETGRHDTRHRYTFDNLGTGVGLVASRMISMALELNDVLKTVDIKHRFVLGIGDFEANDPKTRARVGLSHEEFLDCCRQSAAAVREKFEQHGLSVETEMLYERYGSDFDNHAKEALAMMRKGNFGTMSAVLGEGNPSRDHVRTTAKKYQPFYARWYNKPDMTVDEAQAIVITQGAQYAALSYLQHKRFGECSFQIAADRPEMQPFGSLLVPVPTLCAKRHY